MATCVCQYDVPSDTWRAMDFDEYPDVKILFGSADDNCPHMFPVLIIMGEPLVLATIRFPLADDGTHAAMTSYTCSVNC